MKIYRVGGCVRDKLLGHNPKDIDYVVVGSSPEEMLACGFTQVGAAFPVFLKDGSEYALARTEKKVGVGYHGFDVDFAPVVTLEQDLYRRDLTINSMAEDIETGEIIDPYLGQQDLKNKVLRHTSEAFAEDPVRILRTARFAARYPEYSVSSDTLELMKRVVPELEFVASERIWAEIEKGLMESHPKRMFDVLEECGAYRHRLLRLYQDPHKGGLINLDASVPLSVRFTAVSSFIAQFELYHEHNVPNDCKKISKYVHDNFSDWCYYPMLSPARKLQFLVNIRAFTCPSDVELCFQAISLRPTLKIEDETIEMIRADIKRIRLLPTDDIIGHLTVGQEIKQAIYIARLTELTRDNYA